MCFRRFAAGLVLLAVAPVSGLAQGGVDVAMSGREAPPPPPPGLRAYLKSEMQKRRIPGMQVAVVRHGRVVLLDAFGVANIEHGIPVTNETVFPINSATKAFTGVALMQLVESGKLDLTAPISRYLDGLPTAWQAVTVGQLATHTSGLPDIINPETGRLVVDNDNPEAAWAKVQTFPMEFAPGEKYSYNQSGYLLLGKIIDKLSDEPFTHFIKERQFDVVGMPRSVYGGDRDIILNSARTYAYMRMGNGQWEKTDTLYKPYAEFAPFLRTAAGLNTTAQEIARWVIALQQGRLLKEKSSLTTLWTPGVLKDGKRSVWAIGWPVFERPKHRVYAVYGGAKAAFAVYPDDDLAVVILTNLQGSMPEQLIDEVAAYYIPDMKANLGGKKSN